MLKKYKVNFEDAKTMLRPFIDFSQIWFYSFYMKSGYHHIDIFPSDQDFLGFFLILGGVIHYYKSTVFAIWLVYRALHFHQSNEALSEVLAFFRFLG